MLEENVRGKRSVASESSVVGSANTELKIFSFEVLTVNERGEEVKQKQGQAQYFTEDLGNGIELKMVYIPGGNFRMGTEEEEIERLVKKFNDDGFRGEKLQPEVTIQPYFMGKFQVTQVQWKAIASLPKVKLELKSDSFWFKGDNLPVDHVSWSEAVEFCQRLSLQRGKEYRLPSEAEWEYACRAGMATPFYFGETITRELANYRSCGTYASEAEGKVRGKTTPVGSFPPNGFGLYDLHGNVREWCEDDWHNDYQDGSIDGSKRISGNSTMKIVRGGYWGDHPVACRSGYRYGISSDDPYETVGFRVVCVASSA